VSRVLRVVVSLAVLVSLFVFPTSFQVASGELPDVGDRESHCVMFVVGQRPDGELIMSDADCFSDEMSADVWASYGVPAVKSDSTLEESGGVYASSSTFTLGRHYDGFNGSGSSVRIVGSSCTGGYWNTSSSWDNRISSSYNGCSHLKHWDWPYKNGTAESTYGSGTTDNLSYMNNQTESVSYH
jgi:hypothetical protein